MTTYAATTSVDSSTSRAEIERTLTRYGATSFQYGTRAGMAMVGFEMKDRQVRFTLQLPDPNEQRFTHHSRGARTSDAAAKEYDQAVRQKWRALALVVKAKLEAVESGISEFEQEFGMNVVMPDGRTVFEHVTPGIAQAYLTGSVKPLLALEGK